MMNPQPDSEASKAEELRTLGRMMAAAEPPNDEFHVVDDSALLERWSERTLSRAEFDDAMDHLFACNHCRQILHGLILDGVMDLSLDADKLFPTASIRTERFRERRRWAIAIAVIAASLTLLVILRPWREGRPTVARIRSMIDNGRFEEAYDLAWQRRNAKRGGAEADFDPLIRDASDGLLEQEFRATNWQRVVQIADQLADNGLRTSQSTLFHSAALLGAQDSVFLKGRQRLDQVVGVGFGGKLPNNGAEKSWGPIASAPQRLESNGMTAIEVLRAGLQQFPNAGPLQLNLGSLLLDRDDYDGALDAFRKAANAIPASALPPLGIGLTLFELGEYQRAAEQFERAGRLASELDAPAVNQAICLEILGSREARTLWARIGETTNDPTLRAQIEAHLGNNGRQ